MKEPLFFKNFNYPRPKPLSKFKLAKRRLLQLQQILFSKEFLDAESLHKGVKKHYSLENELNFYEKYCEFGLHEDEKRALQAATKNNSKTQSLSILVIGCGSGREAFYLEKEFPMAAIDAIDNSPEMIQRAGLVAKQSKVNFISGDIFQLEERYDLLWVTAILESHIHGKENRIHFFKQVQALSKAGASAVFTPQIRKIHWKSHHYWGSQLLRLRWFNKKMWQEGDVVMANLGAHHVAGKLVYSHFYPSAKHFEDELYSAKLKVKSQLPCDSWICET